MGQIEREIKLLNVDVMKIKNTLHEKGIEPKGKYIQDVYTYDLLTVDGFYKKYIDEMINNNDNRGFFKLIKEIKPCFDKEDIKTINDVLGCDDILDYINSSNCDYNKLLSEKLIKLMEKTEDNFSKWIRLRQTGDETTITIKKIVDSKGEYELDAVEELEFNVPDIETGKAFLEDLGYFFARHQIKMRIAYDYKNTEIVIDKWPMLNPYVEIEGSTADEINEAVEMLGYNVEDAIIINTDDVYLKAGIDIYDNEHSDLSYSEDEKREVTKYME